MNLNFVIAVVVVFAILLLNEWWWHGRKHGELSRKFVHVTVGTFVAFWPLFLTWQQIEFLSLTFVVVITLSRQFNIFKSIHSVQRPTWGEIFFAAAVGLVAIMTHNPAIYAVALLHMSLADGLAAVIGSSYGGKSMYQIFGAAKSPIGTLTFFIISALLLFGFAVHMHTGFSGWYFAIAVGSTLLENLAGRGFDNLFIPLLVAWLLGLAL